MRVTMNDAMVSIKKKVMDSLQKIYDDVETEKRKHPNLVENKLKSVAYSLSQRKDEISKVSSYPELRKIVMEVLDEHASEPIAKKYKLDIEQDYDKRYKLAGNNPYSKYAYKVFTDFWRFIYNIILKADNLGSPDVKDNYDSKGRQIAKLFMNYFEENNPSWPDISEEYNINNNELTLNKRVKETYRFNDDGSVDFVNIKDVAKYVAEHWDEYWSGEEEEERKKSDEEIDTDTQFFINNYSHFNSVLDFLDSGLIFIIDLRNKYNILKKVDEILKNNDNDSKVKDYTETGYTVSWFRNKMEYLLNKLDNFSDDDLIEIKTNTYWIKSEYFVSLGSIGFVDLKNPVVGSDEEDDEDFDIDDSCKKDTYPFHRYTKSQASDPLFVAKKAKEFIEENDLNAEAWATRNMHYVAVFVNEEEDFEKVLKLFEEEFGFGTFDENRETLSFKLYLFDWEAEDSCDKNLFSTRKGTEESDVKDTSCNDYYEPISSFKEFKYIDKTKNGLDVVKVFEDLKDNRMHVIVHRPYDDTYIIGLGYSPDDGVWNQGRYDFKSLEKAEDYLKKDYEVKEFQKEITDASSALEKEVPEEKSAHEDIYRYVALKHDEDDMIKKAKNLGMNVIDYNENTVFIDGPLSKMAKLHNVDEDEIVNASKERMSTITKITTTAKDSVKKSISTENNIKKILKEHSDYISKEKFKAKDSATINMFKELYFGTFDIEISDKDINKFIKKLK